MSGIAESTAVAIIADDEDIGRLLLVESVAKVGLQSLDYGNGASALQAALASEVAIVLLDVDMPGMDGFSVCRRLRAEPRFATVPIVMVTGHEDSEAIGGAFNAGATDFISKPVNWALLPRRLEYILRNASSARALSERMVQVRTLVEALPDTLWVVAADGSIQWSPTTDLAASPASQNPDAMNLAPPEHLPDVRRAIRQTAQDGLHRKLEYRSDGAPESGQSYELRFSRREGGDVVVVRQDTTERTAAAAHIEQLAYYDSLTRLPNRQRCIETAEQQFAKAAERGESVVVIYLDLNGFKRINDTFGHSVGDTVLRTVTGRLTRALSTLKEEHPQLVLARFGGDEFVIVLRHSTARTIGIQIAEVCSEDFKNPILYESLEFYPAPSIGLAVYPDDGADVTTVFKHADTAMYHAKASAAGSVAIYSPAMSSRLRDWVDLEARLRRAVHGDLLHLVFQPKFCLQDGQLAGVEALLRWCDADLGEVPPSRFVKIAEDGGLILDMSHWVVRAVCRQLREWMDRGFRVPIAVNCSGKELLHGDPAHIIQTEAAAVGVPTSLLEVEITESVLVSDCATVRRALRRLRDLGCRIALDDFGTGYSSLAYISRLPPDRIKIDKSFVKDVERSPRDGAVASAILSLGASLNVIVTAEGVERTGQLEWLRTRGCQEAQGFLLSRPLRAAELERRFLSTASDPTSTEFAAKAR